MPRVPLVHYQIAYAGIPLPSAESKLYDYILAGNGVFVRGERKELAVLIPIAACEIRGLAAREPLIELRVPRVPHDALRWMLDQARQAVDADGKPAEIIFHLSIGESGIWSVEIPEQIQGPVLAKPLDDSASSSYARAFVEVHSHVDMAAHFSSMDDGDEVGFRVYAILGRITRAPELHVRVGLYGYHWEIPADEIFELPAEISDAKEVGGKMELEWRR